MISNRIQFTALVLVAACAAGGGVGCLAAYMVIGSPRDTSPQQSAVAETTTRENDALHNELRDLRAELGKLREAVNQSPRQDLAERKSRDPELITYQGKLASSWLAVLNDRDPATRVNAVAPLAAISAKQPNLVPVVIKCLEDEDEKVRLAAVSAASTLQVSVQVIVPALVATDVWCRDILPVLQEIDPRGEVAVSAALKVLHHPKPRVRRNAGSIVYAFDKSKASLALSAYIEALQDWTEYGGRDCLPNPFDANNHYCSQAELALMICQDMGTQDQDAVPSILKALKQVTQDASFLSHYAHVLPFVQETIHKLELASARKPN